MKSVLFFISFFGIALLVNSQEQNPYNNLWNKKDSAKAAKKVAVDTLIDKKTTVEIPKISNKKGKVNVQSEPLLSKVIDYRKNWLDSVNTGLGFRVQIYAASGPNSKSLAREKRNQFKMYYEHVNAYIVSNMPYFKVRVGDFSSRMQALGFLEEIKHRYPQSFVVSDEVVLR